MTNMLAPCKDCQKRVLGCHSTCEDYLNFRKYLAKIKKEKRLESSLQSYEIEKSRKRKRRWNI